MSVRAPSSRPLEPGTTGWTASDLDDPAIEREWFEGRYEIVEGVLSKMPPAYFAGGNATVNLIVALKAYSKAQDLGWRFAAEADIIVDDVRVPRADAVMLTPADVTLQDRAALATEKPDPKRVRILVPPTLIIESVSPGHELHDRRLKRAWYAEFGVPNYWIVDAYARGLECLRLGDGQYAVDAGGRGQDVIRPDAFPGLIIPLQTIWEE